MPATLGAYDVWSVTMSEALRQQVRVGLFWSLCERVGQQAVQAGVSIVLARLLLPSDVGLIGMIWVFLGLSCLLAEGGMGQALLLRKEEDRGTETAVLYFNLLVALLAAAALWVAAPLIAAFYRLPELSPVVRAMSVGLPIGALSTVPANVLSRRLDMKSQAKVGIISALLSGCVAISFAFYGCGVWSLIAQALTGGVCRSILLWSFSHWRPVAVPAIGALRPMLSIGVNVLSTNITGTLLGNISPVVIGKLYSKEQLGFFSMASRLPSLLGESVSTIVSRVSIPSYPKLRDDPLAYRAAVRKAITCMMAINIPLMFGLLGAATPLVRFLLTDKWLPCVPYLQLVCILQVFNALHYGNVEAVLGLGRTQLFFGLSLLRNALLSVSILAAWKWGVIGLLSGQIVASGAVFAFQAFYMGRCTGYRMTSQVRDILPYLFCGGVMVITMWASSLLQLESVMAMLFIQLSVGLLAFVLTALLFSLSAYVEIWKMLMAWLALTGKHQAM